MEVGETLWPLGPTSDVLPKAQNAFNDVVGMYLRNSNSIGSLSCLILVLMLLIAEESKKSNQIDQKLHPKAHIIPRVKNNILMNEMCST